jgi:hypothetical protein
MLATLVLPRRVYARLQAQKTVPFGVYTAGDWQAVLRASRTLTTGGELHCRRRTRLMKMTELGLKLAMGLDLLVHDAECQQPWLDVFSDIIGNAPLESVHQSVRCYRQECALMFY